MASMTTTTVIPFNCFHSRNCRNVVATNRISFIDIKPHNLNRVIQHVLKPISAVGSRLETSITDPKDSVVTFKNVKIVVESQEESKIQHHLLQTLMKFHSQLKVDLKREETEKIFGKILTNLAQSAPPIPGFRREKGGKTSKVPRDFLLQILGEDCVTNFVIQEIVSSIVADYAKKENLNVKDSMVITTQKADKLKKMFKPRDEFGFNAVLELEKTETETRTETKAEAEVETSS